MRARRGTWRVVATLAAMALTAGACGDDDDAGAAGAGAAGSGGPVGRFTEAELDAALLDDDDLPAGWTPIPGGDEDDDLALCGLGDLSEELGYDSDDYAEVDATFAADPNVGPILVEQITEIAPGVGPEGLDLLEDAIGSCDPFERAGATWTPGILSFPDHGDGSIAFRFTISDGRATADLAYVYVLHGDVVIALGMFAVLDDPAALLEQFAPLALDKAMATLD